MRVNVEFIQFENQVIQFIRIGLASKRRHLVIALERFLDIFGVVCKVENERVLLFWVAAVQSAKRLHGLDISQALIDIHGVQQRFVIPCLELVGDNENAIRVHLHVLFDIGRRELVEARLGFFLAVIHLFPAERDNSLIRATHILQLLRNGVIVINRSFDSGSHHHGTGLSTHLVLVDDVIDKVVYNDGGLFLDRFGAAFHIPADFLLRLVAVKFWIFLSLADDFRFNDLVVTLVRRVIFQHIQDKAFLNGLAHGVIVVRFEFRFSIRLWNLFSEHFESLVLGSRGKGVVICVLYHLAAFDGLVQDVFEIFLVLDINTGNRHVHFSRKRATLATMRLIDDDCKTAVSKCRSDFLENERELVNNRDNNPLARSEFLAKRFRRIRPADNIAELVVGIDVVADLLVEVHTVGHDDDGIHQLFRSTQLLGQHKGKPRNRIRLTRARTVLNQELLTQFM